MASVHPDADLAPRDVVSRAIANEQQPKLNIAPLLPMFDHRFPSIHKGLCARGFNFNEDYEIPIQPSPHYSIGGILTDVNGITSLPHFYAIGECANTGFHGANRLASNSLLEAATMGVHCARDIAASRDCINTTPATIHRIIEIAPIAANDIQTIQKIMNSAMGVRRSQESLLDAMQYLNAHPLIGHPMGAFVLAIIESAYHRTESRGGHFMSDYPEKSTHPKQSSIQVGKEIVHRELTSTKS